MTICNSSLEDLPEIFRLYALATHFQKLKFPENQWPLFDQELIATEIVDARQFKLLIENKIACIWAITYSDAQIWEERENRASLYIHRIATNPEFRGNNFVRIIVDWAKDFARSQNKRYIRMDTCGYNERLIDHYKACGFDFLEMKKLKDPSDLPVHYHDADVCLFQIDLA